MGRPKKGVPTKRVEWTPVVGMKIETLYYGGNGRAGSVAEIVSVLEDGTIRVRHKSGRFTFLSASSARMQWRPYQPQAQIEFKNVQVSPVLSEADVRRIVRDELRAMFASKDGAS